MTIDASAAQGVTLSVAMSAAETSGPEFAITEIRAFAAMVGAAACRSAAVHVRLPSSTSGVLCAGPADRTSPPPRTSRKKSWCIAGSGSRNGSAIG